MSWHGVQLPSHTPGSSEWMRQVSASKIPAIMGFAKPYASPVSLFFEMTGRIEREQMDTPAIRRGRRLEAFVLDEVQDIHPGLALERGANFHHPAGDWWTAAPDAHSIPDSLIVEAKTATTRNAWKWGRTFEEAPIGYQLQVGAQLLVTGADHALLSLLYSDFDEFEFKHLETTRDAFRAHHEGQVFTLADIEDAVQEFKACLDWDEPPILDGSEATYQAIRELNPNVEDGETIVTDALAETYVQARRNRLAWETEENRAKSELMALAAGTRNIVSESGVKIATRQKRGKSVSFIPNPKLSMFYTEEK